MSNKKEGKIIKEYIYIFLMIFLIILIFTFIDFLIHDLSEEYAVPGYYFINKIIFGTGIGFISYIFIKRKELLIKSFLLSLIVSVLLQVRYLLEGYPIEFVLEFLLIHFFILFAVSLVIFKLLGNLIIKRR